jgi:5-methylcytosine-specific restriction protein A
MLYAELDGQPYNKAEVNRRLREGTLSTRTKGSIEFRMQNISAALYELKMPWIAGYLPARNIGSSVKEKLIELLRLNGVNSLVAFVPTSDQDTLQTKVSALRKRHLGKVPNGCGKPAVITTTSTSYVRDPAVKAWVLQSAKGVCEGCGNAAPFAAWDGLPYLEVHHVMPLASHGSDTVSNAVALCPNCHRRCHFSTDRDEFKLDLYQKVSRLIPEAPDDTSFETDEFI